MRPSFVRRAAALAAVVVVSAGLVAGCSSKGKDGTDSGTGASDLGAHQVDLTKTVGKPGVFDVPGSATDTVTVGVLGLKVEGKMQVLSLVFTPHFTAKTNDAKISLYDMLGSTSFSPRLVDRTNLKIYSPLDSTMVSSEPYTETVNEKPVYVYAVFAAPENPDTATFDLQIIDSWAPLTVEAKK